MKKGLLMTLLAVFFSGSVAFATTVTFSTTSFQTLQHGTDYTWQTDKGTWGIPEGDYITSATLSIFGLNNSEEPEIGDYMNIYILNNPYSPNWPTKSLLTVYSDTNGYYYQETYYEPIYRWVCGFFGCTRKLVGYEERTRTKYANPGEDLIYNLSASQISDLTAYLSDKIFGIGLDPNCHYSNTMITFTITTDKIPVQTPEAASLILFGLGLLGVAGLRRKIKK
jgi:hypothetical protein